MSAFTNLRPEVGVGNSPWRFASLRSSMFLRNVGILSGGTAIGHTFTLAAAPVLTRLYRPPDFGRLALFTSFLGVVGVAVTLRYEFSIVSGKNESEAAYLTLASLLLAPPMSLLAGVVLWFLIHFSALGYGGLSWYTAPLLSLAVCFLGIFTTLRYWCLREERFVQVSQGVVVQSAGRAIFQTVLGIGGLHGAGLVLGETLGRSLGVSRMLRSAWPALRFYVAGFRRQEFMQALWRNRKFPMYSLPSSFLDALCISLPVPLLTRLYGASIAGYFAVVWTAITVPTVLVTVAIGDTFHSRMAACARETPERVMDLFLQTSLSLLLLGSIPAAILWFFGAPLFRLVFGGQWAVSGVIAAMVVPWYFADFVINPLSRTVLVLRGLETKLFWDVLSLGSLAALFFVAQWRSLAPLETIKDLTIVNSALRVAYFGLLVHVVMRFKRVQRAENQAV